MQQSMKIKNVQIKYFQMIINLITLQQTQISLSIKKFTQQKIYFPAMTTMVIEETNNTPVFSRITTDIIKKCNFCTKTSYYQDMENKLYCWFHRSQFE